MLWLKESHKFIIKRKIIPCVFFIDIRHLKNCNLFKIFLFFIAITTFEKLRNNHLLIRNVLFGYELQCFVHLKITDNAGLSISYCNLIVVQEPFLLPIHNNFELFILKSKRLNKISNNTSLTANSVEKNALLPQEEFLKKFKISSKAFSLACLKWSELIKIHSDYISNQGLLQNIEKEIIAKFLTPDAIEAGVHSVRSRLKKPDSLIEKIIRKSIDANKKGLSKNITIKNYTSEILDLIGIRILHVFKNDWFGIHNYIISDCKYKTKEVPTVYYRQGDEKSFVDGCKKSGCDAKIHPKAYRSIHYIINPYPLKNIAFVEIQVRTVFEDGWSEIDHKLRYVSKKGTKHVLDSYLLALNRIAGSADEIGTLIKNRQIELRQEEYESQLRSHKSKK